MARPSPRLGTAPWLSALGCALLLAGCSDSALERLAGLLGSRPAAQAGGQGAALGVRPGEAAPEASLPTMKTYKTYRDPQGLFSCDVPSAWARSVDEGTETRNVSFMLRLPRTEDPKRSSVFSLSVYHYAPGGGQFSSADDFVRRNAQALPGAEAEPVKEVLLKAGPARRWSMTLPPMGFPEAMGASRIRESLVVVRAGKGFFVLSYSSPDDAHASNQPYFERLLETFAPSVP
ncbi:MAG: hypothetical protein HZB91_14035 [Elusimicrobia bacterium]|nr:hypothetical protein [Elusimicrobiota bacterium]